MKEDDPVVPPVKVAVQQAVPAIVVQPLEEPLVKQLSARFPLLLRQHSTPVPLLTAAVANLARRPSAPGRLVSQQCKLTQGFIKVFFVWEASRGVKFQIWGWISPFCMKH